MNVDQQTGKAVFGGLLASSVGTFILMVRALVIQSPLSWLLAGGGLCITCAVAVAARRWWRTF